MILFDDRWYIYQLLYYLPMDLEDVTSADGESVCKVIVTCICDIHYAFTVILLLFIRLIVVLREECKGSSQRNQEKSHT